MPDLDTIKLVDETPDSIVARVLADMNAGLAPTDPFTADVIPGSIENDLVRNVALEQDRIYDRINTIVLLAMPTRAVGDFLDGWADAVGLQRKDEVQAAGVVRFTGPNGTPIPSGSQVTTVAPDPDSEPVAFQVTEGGVVAGGLVDLPVLAVVAGTAGSVPANSITLYPAAPPGVAVTNPNRITGGADVETDEELASRIRRKLSGTGGAGNVDYYVNLALNYPGVGFATVQPNTPARGDVTILLRDVANAPVPATIIDGFQLQVDPYPSSLGGGDATIGAAVHVTTPATTNVDVHATIVPASGYSVTGAGGTRALAATITDALVRAVNTLGVGEDVLHNRVLAAIVDVEGVTDVSALTLNGAAGDVAIDATHVASLVLPVTLA